MSVSTKKDSQDNGMNFRSSKSISKDATGENHKGTWALQIEFDSDVPKVGCKASVNFSQNVFDATSIVLLHQVVTH